jgi:hypothetical protein
MHGYLPRRAEAGLDRALARAPAAVILGPRQCGKSTVDLVLERGARRLVFEIKLSKAPQPSRGFHTLVGELQPEAATILAPIDAPFEWRRGIWVMDLAAAITHWGEA